MASITEAEVIEAIRLSLSPDSDVEGFSSYELSVTLGISQGHAQERIRQLARADKLKLAGTRLGTALDGKPCRIPVYRLI